MSIQAILTSLLGMVICAVGGYIAYLRRQNNILQNKDKVKEIKDEANKIVTAMPLDVLVKFSNDKRNSTKPK